MSLLDVHENSLLPVNRGQYLVLQFMTTDQTSTHPMGLHTPHLHAVSLTMSVYKAPALSKVPFLHLVSGKPLNDPVLQPLHQNHTNGDPEASLILLHVRETRF